MRYVQNHCTAGPAGDAGATRPYGLGEVWFDSFQSAEAADELAVATQLAMEVPDRVTHLMVQIPSRPARCSKQAWQAIFD
jgi:hypothetical protein